MDVSGERRALILEVAKRWFAREGFKATTIRDIAGEAHILPGSIYHHFSNKEEMLLEIVLDDALALLSGIQKIARAKRIPAEVRFAGMIEFYIREMQRGRESHAISYNERRFIAANKAFARVFKSRARLFQSWSQVVRDGVREGQFREGADDYLIITNLIRTLHGTADWLGSPDPHLLAHKYTIEDVIAMQSRMLLAWVRVGARVDEPVPTEDARRLIPHSKSR